MEVILEVTKTHEATRFSAVDPSDPVFSEGWLQETLRRHPDILPVDEFGPAFYPLVSIGREVPTSAGPIDNLFISHSGYLVLVETKLWRNPEARREVVAQLMDYSTAMTKFTYEDLDAAARHYLTTYENSSRSLEDWIEHKLDPVDVGFQGRVSRNLRLGRFLHLIVTDQERPTVIDMLSRLSAKAWWSMDMAVVTLRPFRREGDGSENLFLVPQVSGRTEIIERSSVEVVVTGAVDAEVTVRKERPEDEAPDRRRAPLTSEIAFWELMQDKAPQAVGQARRLIEHFRDDPKINFGLRESSIVVEVHESVVEVPISLFFIKVNGVVGFWPGTIRRRLRANGLSESLADEYVSSVRTLWSAAPDRTELYCDVGRIDVVSLRDAVDRFVNRLETSSRSLN